MLTADLANLGVIVVVLIPVRAVAFGAIVPLSLRVPVLSWGSHFFSSHTTELGDLRLSRVAISRRE